MGGTGSVDTTTQVVFYPKCAPITCRQSRLKCCGCHACSEINPELLNITQYELDPSSRDRIFAAQQKTRQEEGNSIERQTVTFAIHVFFSNGVHLNLVFLQLFQCSSIHSTVQCSGSIWQPMQRKTYDERKA